MQREIVYTLHLTFRLQLRGIPPNLPRKIYQNAKERYFDADTKKLVAVMKVAYQGKKREMSLIYEETQTEAILVTIHPLKPYQKRSRIMSERWQKIGREN